MSQFSTRGVQHPPRPTLSDFIPIPGVYPAGRLDADSEGLMLLTDDGQLQHKISHPNHKEAKTYLVQIEGIPNPEQLNRLQNPLNLGDFVTQACQVQHIHEPDWLWPRNPPIRARSSIPTSWIAITIKEGKNRQIRRMTAAVGLPTLRLIRSAIGPYSLLSNPLLPGEWVALNTDQY